MRKAEGSGDDGRGLCEVLRGEELRSDAKDTPCLRISWTALSLVRDGLKSQLSELQYDVDKCYELCIRWV